MIGVTGYPQVLYGRGIVGLFLPEDDHGGDGQAEEDPLPEDDIREKPLERPEKEDEDHAPDAHGDDRNMGRQEFRVDGGQLLEKDPVFGHGIIDPRRAQEILVGRAHDRKEDDERDDRGADGTHDQIHRVGGDPVGFGDRAGREDIQIGQLGQDIDGDAGRGPDEEPQGKVALRIFGLAGAVGGRVPSFISPERCDQGDAETAQKVARKRLRRGGDEVRRLAFGENKDHAADADQGPEFDDGQEVLKVRPPAHADVVHR